MLARGSYVRTPEIREKIRLAANIAYAADPTLREKTRSLCFPVPSTLQQQNIERDARINDWLAATKWTLVRFAEHNIDEALHNFEQVFRDVFFANDLEVQPCLAP